MVLSILCIKYTLLFLSTLLSLFLLERSILFSEENQACLDIILGICLNIFLVKYLIPYFTICVGMCVF